MAGMYADIQLRNNSCWQCVHCVKGDGDPVSGRHKKRLCDITGRWGSLQKGWYCLKYEYRQLPNVTADDGIPVRNRLQEDYRTRKQWEEAGRKVKDTAEGVVMHANRHSTKTYLYFLEGDTIPC